MMAWEECAQCDMPVTEEMNKRFSEGKLMCTTCLAGIIDEVIDKLEEGVK